MQSAKDCIPDVRQEQHMNHFQACHLSILRFLPWLSSLAFLTFSIGGISAFPVGKWASLKVLQRVPEKGF